MCLRLVAFAILIALTPVATGQSPNSTSNATYKCNYAIVKGHLEQGTYVTIRLGPGAQFKKLDRLHSGKEVYICDESGDWFKVFYSDSNGPCGSTSSNGLDVTKARGCHSGWVEKKWIEVISG
jgi:hypothetical protein